LAVCGQIRLRSIIFQGTLKTLASRHKCGDIFLKGTLFSKFSAIFSPKNREFVTEYAVFQKTVLPFGDFSPKKNDWQK
jgi:hypothetical protein